MIDWVEFKSTEQLDLIIGQSKRKPCLIFKHSAKCGVSGLVQLQLEEDWDFADSELTPFFLDVIKNRDIARLVAATFEVYHESPQILLIRDGECTYDAAHLDISVEELHECFQDTF